MAYGDYGKRNNTAAQRKQMHYSPNLISTVNNAIDNSVLCELEYDSREKGITKRIIEPMAIVYKDRKRNLVAWCRLREDYRSFRLDRIGMIKLLSDTFLRRQDFNIDDFQDSDNGTQEEIYEDED